MLGNRTVHRLNKTGYALKGLAQRVRKEFGAEADELKAASRVCLGLAEMIDSQIYDRKIRAARKSA